MPTRGSRGPSMIDVAEAAGVSAQTVSRTLRGAPHVDPDTKQRVLAAVEKVGYRFNPAARTLSSGRSRTIGLVLLQSGGYYARSAVTAGVERAAAAAGLAVSVATIADLDPTELELAMSRLANQGVDGIVLAVPLRWTTPRVDEITRSVPTVAIDGGAGVAVTPVLGLDQREAGRIATEHLLDLGHATVWHIAGPQEWIEAAQRREGWRDALVARGVEPPPVLEGDWSPASGQRQGRIVAKIPEVTALFVASDEMAFGVIAALREAGRRVPEDISLVSVDDITLAEYCSPPLTTVRQDFDQVGRAAVDLLTGAEPGPYVSPPPEIVVRQTSAPAVGTRRRN